MFGFLHIHMLHHNYGHPVMFGFLHIHCCTTTMDIPVMFGFLHKHLSQHNRDTPAMYNQLCLKSPTDLCCTTTNTPTMFGVPNKSTGRTMMTPSHGGCSAQTCRCISITHVQSCWPLRMKSAWVYIAGKTSHDHILKMESCRI